jgi:hypothetical protein
MYRGWIAGLTRCFILLLCVANESWSWIYDRHSVCQSWCQAPIWDLRPILFLFEISFIQLRVYFVAPSLTSGRVSKFLYNCFWALPEQSLLGWSPAGLVAIFYCLIWDSPNLEGEVPVFISPRNRVAQLYPRTLGSLLSPLTTLKATVEVF